MKLEAMGAVLCVFLSACGTEVSIDAGASGDGSISDASSGDASSGDASSADGGSSDAAALDGGEASFCDPGVGLGAPISTCSATAPCTDLLLTYGRLDPPITLIDTPSDEPTCATSSFGTDDGYPAFTDSAPERFVQDGVTRYWCEVRPAGASPTSQRPLLIYVAGSGGHSGSVYDATLIRDKQPDFDLSADPARPGYVLVSLQPRNLHWPTVDPQEGTKFDSQYRDLASPSTNPDIAFVDHIIDTLVEDGVVDRTRIYLMGWSNGGRFSAFYGIARHETATPGGNYVAAVANYSSGDPFAPPTTGDPTCQADPYPMSALPYYVVSRTCDAIACDAAQDSGTVPGNQVEAWVDTLRDAVGADVTWQRIDDDGRLRGACAVGGLCGPLRQLVNHVRWPDGIRDGSGRDHEPTMLGFLRDHPHPG